MGGYCFFMRMTTNVLETVIEETRPFSIRLRRRSMYSCFISITPLIRKYSSYFPQGANRLFATPLLPVSIISLPCEELNPFRGVFCSFFCALSGKRRRREIPAFGDFLRADRRAARSPDPRFWGYSGRRNAAGLYLQHPSSPSALIASWRSGRCGHASFVYPLARACPRCYQYKPPAGGFRLFALSGRGRARRAVLYLQKSYSNIIVSISE